MTNYYPNPDNRDSSGWRKETKEQNFYDKPMGPKLRQQEDKSELSKKPSENMKPLPPFTEEMMDGFYTQQEQVDRKKARRDRIIAKEEALEAMLACMWCGETQESTELLEQHEQTHFEE